MVNFAVLRVSYDLRQPGRNYAALYWILSQLGSVHRELESEVWIHTPLTPDAVRSRLAAVMDASDRLIVAYMGDELFAGGLSQDGQRWLGGHGYDVVDVAA